MATVQVAVLVRTERTTRGLKPVGRIFEQATKIKGVVDAFPTVGRFDGVVFVEGRTFEEAGDVAVKVHDLDGVRSTETLIQLP